MIEKVCNLKFEKKKHSKVVISVTTSHYKHIKIATPWSTSNVAKIYTIATHNGGLTKVTNIKRN